MAELGDYGLGSFSLLSCLVWLIIARFRTGAPVLLPHGAELVLRFFSLLTEGFHSPWQEHSHPNGPGFPGVSDLRAITPDRSHS